MSENGPSIETLEKQLRVAQRKLERSEWHRADLENQHDRDQHLYRRLQADLEAAQREAQVEAAMERVRSRALAMTSSDELLDVAFKIRKEYAGLGLECGAFWHTRYTPACYQKALTSVDGEKLAAIMELPRDFASNPALAAWERGDEKIGVFPFDTESACRYLHRMVTKGHFREVDPEAITEAMIREHGGWTFVQARTSHGEIGYSLWGETEPSDEAKDVLVRFTGAFDLAHRRFEDLQQAEADHRALLEEKALTERALVELRATQTQLVQAEKLASLGRLTAGIAHEIKNPLNFVNNFAALSQELAAELRGEAEANPDARLRDVADVLADLETNAAKTAAHGRRADAIVRGMMEHARSAPQERREVGLNELVEEHVRLAANAWSSKNPGVDVRVERNYDGAAGTVGAAPQELGRVVVNLVSNALDAVAERASQESAGDREVAYLPVVSVRTRRADGQVEIAVEDNGVGLSEAARSRLFEPFYTTKPTGRGNIGLGLSLSRDVVTAHGGTIEVESREGEGSTFTIALLDQPGERATKTTPGPTRL